MVVPKVRVRYWGFTYLIAVDRMLGYHLIRFMQNDVFCLSSHQSNRSKKRDAGNYNIEHGKDTFHVFPPSSINKVFTIICVSKDNCDLDQVQRTKKNLILMMLLPSRQIR